MACLPPSLISPSPAQAPDAPAQAPDEQTKLLKDIKAELIYMNKHSRDSADAIRTLLLMIEIVLVVGMMFKS